MNDERDPDVQRMIDDPETYYAEAREAAMREALAAERCDGEFGRRALRASEIALLVAQCIAFVFIAWLVGELR